MPAEKIAAMHVDNGPLDQHTNVLRVVWGAKGGCPEAPDGWVNAGYASLSVERAEEPHAPITHAVQLDPDEIDHLIRVLKRVRRQAYRVTANGRV